MSKKILVTGFEAFGGESINPTSLLVEALRKERPETSSNIRSTVLPVTFADAFEALDREIMEFDPAVVICLGQAGGRDSIDLERVAINVIDADIPDNKGVQLRDLPIREGGESAYFSTLPIRPLLDALTSIAIPARISNSAGTYVCNSLLYRLLEKHPMRTAGFIHVPFLPEQVRSKPGVASMEFAVMRRALDVILDYLSQNA